MIRLFVSVIAAVVMVYAASVAINAQARMNKVNADFEAKLSAVFETATANAKTLELADCRLQTAEQRNEIADQKIEQYEQSLAKTEAKLLVVIENLEDALVKLDARQEWMTQLTDWMGKGMEDRFTAKMFADWCAEFFDGNPMLAKPRVPMAAKGDPLPEVPRSK